MSFKLRPEYVFNLLTEAATGNPGPLIEALDPDIRWRIGSETQDDAVKTGFYNRAGWLEQVFTPLQSKLQSGLKLIPLEVDVVGMKAYVEFRGEATQNNGKPYNNNYFWVMIFDEHGHAIEIREYLDTGLVKEVFATN